MKVIHKIDIHLDDCRIIPEIRAMQCDANTRALEFSLFNHNQPFNPPSIAKIYVSYRKADGTGGLYDTLPDGAAACAVTDNIITAILAEQVLTVPGKVRVAITIQIDNLTLSTFAVQLRVDPNPGIGAAESEDYFCIKAAITAAKKAAAQPMRLITVSQSEDGGYQSDYDVDMIQAMLDAKVPFACYWYEEIVTTYLADYQDGGPFSFTTVSDGIEYHVLFKKDGTINCNATALAKKSDVPTRISQLINDSGFSTDGGSGSGADGITPHIGDNGNWFIGETDTGMPSRGEDAPQEAILYTPQALSPEQQAQARQNIGAIEAPETAEVGQTIVVKEVDENGKPTAWEAADFPAGGGYEWEKIAELTAEENIFSVTLPIDGNQYKLLRLKAKAQAWVVAEEAVYVKNGMLYGARTCGLHAIGYGQNGKYTPFEVWCFNLRDNQFLPVGMVANGNPIVNGSFIAYNQIYNESVTINSSISVTAFSSKDYLFTAGSTFELWGVRK